MVTTSQGSHGNNTYMAAQSERAEQELWVN